MGQEMKPFDVTNASEPFSSKTGLLLTTSHYSLFYFLILSLWGSVSFLLHFFLPFPVFYFNFSFFLHCEDISFFFSFLIWTFFFFLFLSLFHFFLLSLFFISFSFFILSIFLCLFLYPLHLPSSFSFFSIFLCLFLFYIVSPIFYFLTLSFSL